MIQLYTGNGKGKTTAAIGLCVRAAGHGRRCLIIQFMKNRKNGYGEFTTIDAMAPAVTIESYGLSTFVKKGAPSDEDIRQAELGFARAAEVIRGGDLDLLVLDEVNVAVEYGLLGEQRVAALLTEVPDTLEVILTGRYAPESFMAAADLITEMREVRHYFSKGVNAREGFEF